MMNRQIVATWKGATAAFIAAAFIVIIAICGLICGCSSQRDASSNSGATDESSADNDLTKIDFVLDYTPNTNHTGIYVAIEEGYYAEAGLDVSVVQPPEDGADALVASGKAQLGMSYQDVMANYLGSADPLPVTAVAAVIQHNTSGIVSTESADITRPKDMEGKRYATWNQNVEQAIVKTVVEQDGGDFSLVDLVPIGNSDEVSGLKADMFDASWGYEAWAYQNAVVQEYPVNYFSFISIDPTFDFYTPVIIANDEFLANDPDTVRAFLAATQKGYEFAAEHPDEAAQIVVDAVPELDYDLILIMNF